MAIGEFGRTPRNMGVAVSQSAIFTSVVRQMTLTFASSTDPITKNRTFGQNVSNVRFDRTYLIDGSMALYHFNAKIVKRSEGRSATQVAAYKLGQPILCKRTGQKFNYSKGCRVTAYGIEAPANAPCWAFDNEQLWNAVEVSEVRKDAQLLRDFEVALPFELCSQAHVRIVESFARAIVQEFSVVVGWGIHAPRCRTSHDFDLCINN
jgi:hypothetical protein